jgi:ATP-dependent RNA helicase RhlE
LKSFDSLGLIEPLTRALAGENYKEPTPIQEQAIPHLLEGNDVLGCAQTGTGKTAAFLLPILQKLTTEPSVGKPVIRALVLTPTRELAAQIGQNFENYSRFVTLRKLVIFGGVKQGKQVASLKRGVDVLIATPGRLLDLQNQGYINLSCVSFFVLDEADRMLDMGFIHDIRKVLAVLPKKRQNLLFSATMPNSIAKLAGTFLHEPIRVEVNPQSTTVERITQRLMYVQKPDKKRLLVHLLDDPDIESAIVFTRTKHGANRVVKFLVQRNIVAVAIHGNKSQNARNKALADFKSGKARILVATDIASRGIDIDGVSHIFNYDLPNIPESYVHRIGRTARAGLTGTAIAFCDEGELEYLRDIEKLTKQTIEVDEDHEWHLSKADLAAAAPPQPSPPQNRGQRPSGNSGRKRGQSRGGRSGPRSS